MMKFAVALLCSIAFFAPQLAEAHDRCSPLLRFRTPQEVLASHRAALAAQDWEAVRCNYGRRAFVISDQGVTEGRDNIVADLQGFAQAFGGAVPVTTEETSHRDVVRVLFSLDLGFITIPDGVDSYVVRFGKIVRQTAHGSVVFVGPPPPPPPAPAAP